MVYNKFYYVFVYSLVYFFFIVQLETLNISLYHPHSLTEKLNEKLGMNVAVAMV